MKALITLSKLPAHCAAEEVTNWRTERRRAAVEHLQPELQQSYLKDQTDHHADPAN